MLEGKLKFNQYIWKPKGLLPQKDICFQSYKILIQQHDWECQEKYLKDYFTLQDMFQNYRCCTYSLLA